MPNTDAEKATPKVPKPTLPPMENLALIAAASQTLVSAADTMLRARSDGIGIADWALLQRLGSEEAGQPMGRVAVHSGVTRQRIQKQIDTLAEQGLVKIDVTEDDKRSRTVGLTQEGRKVLAKVSTAWAARLSEDGIAELLKNPGVVRKQLEKFAYALSKANRADQKATKETGVAQPGQDKGGSKGGGKGRGRNDQADDD